MCWQLLVILTCTQLGWAPSAGGARELPPHPRLLLCRDDVSQLRRQVATLKWKTVYLAELRGKADNWLNAAPNVPDRGGGWAHDYCCPNHACGLRPEGPRTHVCPIGGERFTGSPYDDDAVALEHLRIGDQLVVLGIVYQLTGDLRYAERERDLLMAYAARYTHYPLHGRCQGTAVDVGRVGAQTLDEAVWLVRVVQGADCIWETLGPGQRRHLEEKLFRPAIAVIRGNPRGIHNIQCWHNAAMGLTGLLLDDPDMVAEAIDGPAGFHRQLAKGTTTDGVWYERAWSYHFYALTALVRLAEAARHCGIDLYDGRLKRMFDAPLVLAMPDNHLPSFGDSSNTSLPEYAGLYEMAFARYHDPAYALLLTGTDRRSGDALLNGESLAPPSVTSRARQSGNYTASGFAVLVGGPTSDATWLCLDYGPRGGHTHPDQLSFVLYASHRIIANDPGRVSYGSPHYSGWYRTTVAHNTLIVDGRSQQGGGGSCEAFVTREGFSALTAATREANVGVLFRRTVAMIGHRLLVVVDQVQADREHTFDLAYHNVGRMVTPPVGESVLPPAGAGYNYLQDVRRVTTSSGLHLAFDVEGRVQSRWAIAGGAETTYFTGTGIGRHTQDRVPLVIARRKGRAAVFFWCITLGQPADGVSLTEEAVRSAEVPASVGATAVRIGTTERDYVLVVNPGAGAVRVCGRTVRDRLSCFPEERWSTFPRWGALLALVLLVVGFFLGRRIRKALCLIAFVSLSTTALAAPDPARLKAEYHIDFRNKEYDFQRLSVEPTSGLSSLVKLERRGLRLTVPPKTEGQNVGVYTRFGVRGDFEITASYEVLATGQPEGVSGVGPELYVRSVEGWGHFVAMSQALHKGGASAVIESVYGRKLGRNPTYHGDSVAASARAGRFRIIRTGSTVTFLASQGTGDHFQEVSHATFGTTDIDRVRIAVTFKGSRRVLDVVWQDLSIRAEELPGLATNGTAVHQSDTSWGLKATFLGSALLAGAGLWRRAKARGRRSAAKGRGPRE
ncbi:MAG: heparinase II/III family protein [Isosphaeraceae bacterium]|nr:heparinase II/III family protein [Isosphaeraceae bacterium]